MSDILSGLLTINGQDVYEAYGAFLVEDRAGESRNYEELLRPAERKPVVEVDFLDQDGVKLPQVLPTSLSSREVTLKFAIEADGLAQFLERYSSFFRMIKDGDQGWLNIHLSDLNRSYKMYYLACSDWRQVTHLKSGKVMAKFSVRLKEPNPQY